MTAVVATTLPSLIRSVKARPEGGIITGDLVTEPAAEDTDPLAFFKDRVQKQPDDVAARLDLAHRYLDAAQPRDALEQYLAALKLDPDNAEANAHMGLLLYTTGRPEGALQAVEQSLRTEPRYPEALFFKGVILLEGLQQSGPAADALRAYLDAAPFGSERKQGEQLLEKAQTRSDNSDPGR